MAQIPESWLSDEETSDKIAPAVESLSLVSPAHAVTDKDSNSCHGECSLCSSDLPRSGGTTAGTEKAVALHSVNHIFLLLKCPKVLCTTFTISVFLKRPVSEKR